MRESLKVTEDIGETSAKNTVDLGPVVHKTELTSSGIEDIKDYAQYYRAKCATLNKRQPIKTVLTLIKFCLNVVPYVLACSY